LNGGDAGFAHLFSGISTLGVLKSLSGVGLAACFGGNLAFFISSADSIGGNGSIINGGDGGNKSDKECKVATEACCQTYATTDEQTKAVAKASTKLCKAGITEKQAKVPFMVTCKARVAAKGASKLALGLSAVAAAFYMA